MESVATNAPPSTNMYRKDVPVNSLPDKTSSQCSNARARADLVLQDSQAALHNAVLQHGTRGDIDGAALGGDNDDSALQGDIAAKVDGSGDGEVIQLDDPGDTGNALLEVGDLLEVRAKLDHGHTAEAVGVHDQLGSDFKKVSDFQKRIGSIPRIVELDHLTITGAVNLGRNVTLKGTVIIVATEGSTIDIPPGSVLENCVVQGSLRILEH